MTACKMSGCSDVATHEARVDSGRLYTVVALCDTHRAVLTSQVDQEPSLRLTVKPLPAETQGGAR